jgi:hypothetical protein
MEQDAAGRLHAGVEVDLGVHEGHRYELEHLLHARVHAAQI